jgi:hypothetical protein
MTLAQRPVIACVAENNEEWFTKAYNLVLSVRKMGGPMADTPVIVHFVEDVRPDYRTQIEGLGAEVRVVEPYGSRYRFSNKMRMFDLFEEDWFDALVAIDCDVIFTGDISEHFRTDAVSIVPAGQDHLSADQWLDLYAMFEIEPPEKSCVMRVTGQRTFPYYNTGVMSIPRELGPRVLEAWTRYLARMDRVHEVWPNVVHENQISFALAIAEEALPIRELPVSLNLSAGVPPARAFNHEIEQPYVVHYHKAVDDRGFILASSIRRANGAIDAFNRLRAKELGLGYGGLERVPFLKRMQKSAATRSWYNARSLKRLRKSILGSAAKKVG